MHAAPANFAPDVLVAETARPLNHVSITGQRARRRPHILLATTGQLPSTARLAMELHDAGATVSVIAPDNHPAKALRQLANRVVYRAWAPRQSLEAALRRLKPDVVIPCDERTVRDLHAIWRHTAHQSLKALIERCTAPAANFPVIVSRSAFLALADQVGVRVPRSMPLESPHALDRWIAANPAPFVLKSDGSWAGFGVRVISNVATARDAFGRMTQPISLRLALREAFLEGNHFDLTAWMRRERPAMSVQTYIDGWPANIGVACWQGEVLATVSAESVATVSATGPSTVARIIDNAEMIEAATRVVKALGLSGMVGFDFMIEAATGAAYMIEMNPRNTPICAIPLGPGHDLPEALVARLSDRGPRERPPRTKRDIVVYFPDTWREDPSSNLLHTGFHDVPWEEPDLVRMLMLPERRDRYWVFRALRRVWLSMNAARDGSH